MAGLATGVTEGMNTGSTTAATGAGRLATDLRAGSQRVSVSVELDAAHSPVRSPAGSRAGTAGTPAGAVRFTSGGSSAACAQPVSRAKPSPTAFARDRFMPAPPTASQPMLRSWVTTRGYVGGMTVQPANFLGSIHPERSSRAMSRYLNPADRPVDRLILVVCRVPEV